MAFVTGAITSALISVGVAAGTAAAIATAIVVSVISTALSLITQAIFGDGGGGEGGTPPKDQGVKQRIPTDTKNRLPVVYGTKRQAGSIIFADISSDNQEMAFIIALCEGPVDSISDLVWDDKLLTLDGSGEVSNAVSPDGTEYDFLNGNVQAIFFPTGGRCSNMESFSSRWSADAGNRTMPDTAYMFVKVKYDREDRVTGLTNRLTAKIRGKLVRNISSSGVVSSTYAWSDNPANCLYDYFTNTRYGCSVPENAMDPISFGSHGQFCNEVKSYTDSDGASGSAKRYTTNISVNTSRTLSTTITDLTKGNSSDVIYTLGKFGIQTYKVKTSVASFSEDNIFGRMAIQDAGFDNLVNHLTIRYDTLENNTTTERQVIIDAPASVKNDNEPLLEETLELPATDNNIEAERSGAILLNNTRQSTNAEIEVGIEAMGLETGDVIDITHATPGWSAKLFVVLKVEERFEYGATSYVLTCQEYADAVYADRSINEFDPAPNTNLPDPYRTISISPTVVDASTAIDYFPISQLRVSYSDSDPFLDQVDFRFRPNGTSIWQSAPSSTTDNTTITNLDPSTTYELQYRTISTLGKAGPFIGLSGTTISLDSIPGIKPSAPNNVSATDELYNTNRAAGVRARVVIAWSNPAGPTDVPTATSIVEYKLDSAADYISLGDFAQAPAIINDIEPGLYDFRITGRSRAGILSDTTLINDITVQGLTAVPGDPTNISLNASASQALLGWDRSVDLDVLSGGTVQIRYHPRTDSSVSWATAQIIVDSLQGLTTSKTVSLLEGTYLIKFLDSGGRESINPGVIRNTFAPSGFNFIAKTQEDDTFTGTKTNCSVSDGNLVLDADETTMTYEFANVADLRTVKSVRITPQFLVDIFSTSDLVCSVPKVCDRETFCAVQRDGEIRFEISTTEDDPGGASPVYTDYATLITGDYAARGIRFRVIASVGDTNTRISFEELSVSLDTADVFKTGRITTSAAGDITETYATSFYTGTAGSTVPRIGTQAIGGPVGNTVHIVSSTATGFTISVYNEAGNRVAQSVDYQAIGQ